ncbi:beta-ketoacyl-ACP synthase III [Turicibacter sp. TJ11]|uniref:beta-ketoacyl-ACP synthase III n=1 Tax=Turicibacter sp. TJ11 TaxID=2806443 RepID=UPI001F269779|nr:beta-ketoacyl-ACP synthase III [Turicibacter sp. TJ11]
MAIKVIGTGMYVPSFKVSNQKLESIVETTDEWITTRTGIHNRYIVTTENTVDLAYEAAHRAIKQSHIDSSDIGLIIVATFTPERLTPSTACLVQARLGLNDQQIIAFDLNAACCGFVYALSVAEQFLKTKTVKKALIIGAEVLSKIIDWNDRGTCVLFGDGSGAVVVEYEQDLENSFYLNSAGDEQDSLITTQIPLNHPFIPSKVHPIYLQMNGQQVFKFAITAIKETITKLLEQTNLSLDDISLIIPHQANKRIIDKVVKDLKVSSEKFFLNVSEYGNTSAASIPIALHDAIKKQRLKNGDKVMVIGFGGGLTWGGCIISI